MSARVDKLSVCPITLREANAFVAQHHRHHKPRKGLNYFAVAVEAGGEIVGVAIVSRPNAGALCDGYTAEVTRVCTDGTRNACSMLYAACWRAARGMGYRKLVTYTLPEEGGASLRASNWRCIGEAGGGTWHRPNIGRSRVDLHPTQEKLRWEIESLNPATPNQEELTTHG